MLQQFSGDGVMSQANVGIGERGGAESLRVTVAGLLGQGQGLLGMTDSRRQVACPLGFAAGV